MLITLCSEDLVKTPFRPFGLKNVLRCGDTLKVEFLTKVSGENQEVTPVSPGTALSIHSGSSGLRASGPRPPTLLSVRTPSVYSFVGSGVPSHGQADAGLNDCNGAASASSVPARSRVSTRGLALRVKGPSSSASLVTPSVHTQVSRFGTRRSPRSTLWSSPNPMLVCPGNSFCTEAFTSMYLSKISCWEQQCCYGC